MRVNGILAGLAAPILLAATPAGAAPPPALQAKLEEVVREDGAPGVLALVFRDGREIYRAQAGAPPTKPVPIASASKWMTATLVMTVVDEGKLGLDDTVGRWIPEAPKAVAPITLRQLMSFTSGQGGLTPMADLRQDIGLTLEQSALQIAARPLEDRPGAAFKYGSGAMQIAGLMVERATGKGWTELFDARIAKPLGMKDTYWGNPLQPDIPRGGVRNPNLQAGVFTTAEDYSRFLAMIAAKGRRPGGRILSDKAFAAMEVDQTRDTPRAFMPPGMQASAHYAIGHWCETRDAKGVCVIVSSPGAFGVYPWVDRGSGLSGLFFLQHRLGPVADDLRDARAMILATDWK